MPSAMRTEVVCKLGRRVSEPPVSIGKLTPPEKKFPNSETHTHTPRSTSLPVQGSEQFAKLRERMPDRSCLHSAKDFRLVSQQKDV